MVLSHYLHRATTYLCAGLMLIVSTGVCGCDPPTGGDGGNGGGSGSSNDVTLSARVVDPGAIISVSHNSIRAGETIQVNFVAAGKVAFSQLIPAESDGQVSLMAPPFLNTDTGTFSSGAFAVSIEGIAQTVDLEIYDLPDASGVAPGDILKIIYEETQDTLLNLRDELQDAQDDFGEEQAIDDVLADINAMIDSIDVNGLQAIDSGSLAVTVGSEQVDLTETELRIADRLLLAMINGILVDGGEPPIDLFTSAKILQSGGGLSPSEIEARNRALVNDAVRNIKVSPAIGIKAGKIIITTVGLSLMLLGLGVEAPVAGVVALVGAAVGVAESFYSFATSQLEEASVAAFNGNDPAAFDSSRQVSDQVINQTMGYQAGQIADGIEDTLVRSPDEAAIALNRAVGRGITILDVGIKIRDINDTVTEIKCLRGENGSTQRTIQTSLADIEFCSAIDINTQPGDGPSSDDDSDNGPCEGLSDPFCCTGDEFCDSFLEECQVDVDCGRCGADGFCIEVGCDQKDPDCDNDNTNDNGGNDNSDNGNDNSDVDPPPVVIGQPTMAICPSGFVIDVGVFDPTLINLVIDDFFGADDADSTSAECLYVRQDGGTGSWALSIGYGESSGACDDANNTPTVLDGFVLLSTERTVQVVEVFSAGSRLIDRLDVLGEFIDNAVAAGVGAPCP